MSKKKKKYEPHEENYIPAVIGANLRILEHIFVQYPIVLIRKPSRMEKVLNIDLRSTSISDKGGIGLLKCVEMRRYASLVASRSCLISPQR